MSTVEFIKKNYDNPEKVLKLYHSELEKLKKNFSGKYPFAALSKFDFQVSINKDGSLDCSKIYFIVIPHHTSYDVESDGFRKNPAYTKYLYSETWPKIWSANGKIPKFTRLKFPKDPLTKCDDHKCGIPADSTFQEPVFLNESLHNFRVYVNERDYFMSYFPQVRARWSSGKTFNEKGLKDIREAAFD